MTLRTLTAEAVKVQLKDPPFELLQLHISKSLQSLANLGKMILPHTDIIGCPCTAHGRVKCLLLNLLCIP